MDLIKIYIQEVTRRLPEKTRDDIALELQSTIEDMLPENYTEEDVKKALAKLGDPAVLAEQYRDRPSYLIGPGFYDPYVMTLKLVMPFAISISLIVFFIVQFADWSGEGVVLQFLTSLIGEMIVSIINTALQVFAWVTFAFFIVERSGVNPAHMRATGKKWEPEDLKAITYIPKKKAIPRAEAIASVIWTAIWAAFYFNADHFIGVYERMNGQEDLVFVVPVFNQGVLMSYGLVIFLLVAVEIILAVLKWVKRQWTRELAIANTLYNLFSAILSIVILTNPDLIHPSFTAYMIDLFNSTPAAAEQLTNWIIGGTIAVIVITAAIAIYDGFRKARIHEQPLNGMKIG
jgi:hypothetical protein